MRDLPDHPDRFNTLNKLRMIDEPRPLVHSYARANKVTWHYKFEMAGGAGWAVEIGGNYKTRWMLSSGDGLGQLVVLPAGKPFPAASDLSRFLPEAETARRLFLRAGIAGSEVSLLDSSESSDGWIGVFHSDNGEYRVHGELQNGSGIPYALFTEQLAGDEVVARFDFGSYEHSDTLGHLVPRQVVISDSRLDHVTYIELIDVHLETDDAMSSLVEVPDIGELREKIEGLVVMDFGDPGKEADKLLGTGQTLTWQPESGPSRPEVRFLNHEPADDKEYGDAGRLSKQVGVLVAAVLVVVVGVLIIVFRVHQRA